ncbi:Hsp70 family protein [Paractinoplanes rishiriensis]|uniref:Hsp70 family protein n=1 Tax=Paractinoplanes rishiriensis TaxID=1050105 RepID=UPI003F68D234
MTEIEGFLLGVDLGTSHTVAMLRHPDGRTRPLLFDGKPLLPSAVFRDTAGRLHVGADALRLGHAEPARIEPHPKRRVDDGEVLLGDGPAVPVPDLLAALLTAVSREAVAITGHLPPAVLTHPAAWGEPRRAVLTDALDRAGWPAGTRLLPEPVAAARYFADVLRRPVPAGASLAVFDFGGGTLDVAVVRNEGPSRFTVTASGGADDLGGLDLDAALVDHLGKSLSAAEPEAWRALTDPVTLAQWRARRQFWEDVRGAKEMLSRSAFAPVPVPGVEHAVHLTRAELEAAADPLVRRGVAETAAVLAAAGLSASDLAGLFLVGGSSRVPLVARLLHSELGIAPTVLEQPELPVAEGAILASVGAPPARFTPDSTPPITDTKADAAAPPTHDTAPAAPAPAPAPAPTPAAPAPREPAEQTDERLRAAPVDPWATGEAAALAAGHPSAPHSPPPYSTSPQTSAPPHQGTPRPNSAPPHQTAAPYSALPHQAAPHSAPHAAGTPPWQPPTPPASGAQPKRPKRRLVYAVVAAAVAVLVAAGGVLTWAFWPDHPALDYRPLSEPQRIAPTVPVTADWSDAAIYGSRAYFASSDTTSGAVGVVAIDFDATKPAWSSSAEIGRAPRWRSMTALPVGLALFTDVDSATSTRRMVVIGAERGTKLWERTLGSDDVVHFAGGNAVIADRAGKRLLGLRLADGVQRWAQPDPASTLSLDTNVVAVTTPKDLAGPATVFGRPYEPDLADDPRVVQIAADRSARVIHADTGKVLTTRQNVAGPQDEVVAHHGRLVVLQPEDQRVVAYQLEGFGEPSVLYTPQAQNSRMKDLVPCGDDRVCFGEEVAFDGDTAAVVALDVAERKRVWRRPLADVDALVPVGEAVLASSTSGEMTLIDAAGRKVWTHAGEAARLDGGNVLEFSKPLSRSPSDHAVSGRHLGDQAVPLGSFRDIRTDTCAWNTERLACVAEKDFVLQTFAG